MGKRGWGQADEAPAQVLEGRQGRSTGVRGSEAQSGDGVAETEPGRPEEPGQEVQEQARQTEGQTEPDRARLRDRRT